MPYAFSTPSSAVAEVSVVVRPALAPLAETSRISIASAPSKPVDTIWYRPSANCVAVCGSSVLSRTISSVKDLTLSLVICSEIVRTFAISFSRR